MNNNAKILTNSELKNQTPSYLETIFSISNGHFGVRASDPVAKSITAGTLVNGFFEMSKINYGEKAYGYAENNQTIVNLPDLRAIEVFDAHHRLFDKSQLETQYLNMHKGLLVSIYQVSNSVGQSLKLTLKSTIQQSPDSIIGLRYEIRSINYTGTVTIKKHLNIKNNHKGSDDPRKSRQISTLSYEKNVLDSSEVLKVSTQQSHQFVEIGVYSDGGLEKTFVLKPDQRQDFDFLGLVGPINRKMNLEKYPTFTQILADSTRFWNDFWAKSEVTISGNDELNQAMHYNLFQLMSAAGRDGRTNIAAKGMSGTGYEGHYFWDTEMYMAPFFAFTNNKIARDLIKYRYSLLDLSKKRARTLGVDQGVLFAWRTIDGHEASAYYPAGTAQYHIDADIAYAIYCYLTITGDKDFVEKYGLEIVLETARFWKNFGSYSLINGKKKFCFFDVTGPDEYTALVDNNYYTNRMAKFNLEFAVKLIDEFSRKADSLGVTTLEKKELAKIAKDIYLPYDQKLAINQQDDSSFQKPVWPFSQTPSENYPLLLHYHPLTIYRYQVNKQADTLLADFLFDDLSKEQLAREYDYYEKITTHDSSLSRSIFSALAARIGLQNKAYKYFNDTVRTDLTDLQGNSCDGLHLANLGGSWLTVTEGFGGIIIKNDKLTINNHLPKEWNKLTIRLTYQARRLEIVYLPNNTEVHLLTGKPIVITVDGASKMID